MRASRNCIDSFPNLLTRTWLFSQEKKRKEWKRKKDTYLKAPQTNPQVGTRVYALLFVKPLKSGTYRETRPGRESSAVDGKVVILTSTDLLEEEEETL